MSCWLHLGKCLNNPPEGYYGFVYCIIDDTGKYYWGKKAFTHRKKTKLSKKARVGTRKRVKVEQVDSQWMKYWGSCKPLLEYIKQRGGTQGFSRYIVRFCKDKQSLSYWETHVLCENRVLFRNDTWNGHVMSRFYKGKISE